jgi:subfamily B ATP-binding cassette protein MsbA
MNTEPVKSTDKQIYARLLSYVTPYWLAFVISIIGFLLYSVSNVAFLSLISYLVDSLQGNDPLTDSRITTQVNYFFGSSDSLNRTVIPIAIVVIVLSRGIGTFIGNTFITYVSTNLVHNLRCQLFDQLMKLPSGFFDGSHQGHLVAKVTFHVSQVTGAATDAVKVVLREGLTVVGYLGFLFFLNWKLTLIFLAIAPVIALFVRISGKRFRRISARIQESMGDVTHVATEAVQGHRVVRTFGGADYERKRFGKVSHNNRRQSMKMVVTSSIATPATQLLVGIALAGLVWLVLDPVLLSNMTSGMVVSFITTGGLLAKPIRQLSEVNSTIQKGLAAAEDIFDLFDQKTELDEGSEELNSVRGQVEFKDVSFNYGDELPQVLNGLSFSVAAGETIALVGRSGGGKSTLASLIPRFYSPTSGEILIDGVPIEALSLTNLRQHVGLVTQEVTLFNDSIINNIAYGSLKGSSREKVIAAAKKAYIWDFIAGLDQGLDTIIGDDGVLLSGGQRQRLAIARAFLKDAPILIMDEATSALDSESERYIQSALEEVLKGRTTFIIAHRLSTIEKADRILVMDKGSIVEQGTHSELLARNGHYAQLHNHGPQHSDEHNVPTVARLPVAQNERTGWDFHPLVKAWYTDASWLSLLSPLGHLYERVGRWRRSRIERHQWHAPVPVIVVGNINVGGTGKSPLVLWLVEQLTAKGFQPGVVSRGYGGSAIDYPLEVTPNTDPAESGDEPLMISRRSMVPVVVDPDRVAAVGYLLEHHGCDVVVSDDGLQHYRLYRDVEIAVVDGQRGLGNGRCMPAGPLRESAERLDEVDFVVSNGPSEVGGNNVEMSIEATNVVNLHTDEKIAVDQQVFMRVHAVAGISNPQRFFDDLRRLGYEIIEHPFADHHKFQIADLDFGDDLPILMTEKDAAKCRTLVNVSTSCWFLEVTANLPETFLDNVVIKITNNSDSHEVADGH